MLILVIVGVFLILFFRVPQKIGIIKSPAERLLAGTPDRDGAKTLLSEVAAAGLNTEGIDLYVIPFIDTGENLAIAVLNESEGFSFNRSTGHNPIIQTMIDLVTGDTAQKLNVTRLSLEYRDESSQSLMTLSASTYDIKRFASGTMTQQEFMNVLEGNINYPAILSTQISSMYKLFK
ncbi:hypothetical protein MYX07_03440 [Patescibacteria group bacterium AH-259-L07]|nr:hypothetical protein [Patescibacteria group bacterium AH-259-L07]